MALLEDFFNYYEYNVKKLDMTHVPKNLINQFHEYNNWFDKFLANEITLYSGCERDRHIGQIADWTTDIHTAARFASKEGFLVSISKEGFVRRYNFVSMDMIYDYLVDITKDDEGIARLQDYISESEVYAFELKEYTVNNEP